MVVWAVFVGSFQGDVFALSGVMRYSHLNPLTPLCHIEQGTQIDCVNWMVLKNKIWRQCHTCCASAMDDSRPRIWLISGSLSSGAHHCHHGLPAYSHHDKIPPWWGNVSNDKGGNKSVSNSHQSTIHDKLQLQQLPLVSCSTRPQC